MKLSKLGIVINILSVPRKIRINIFALKLLRASNHILIVFSNAGKVIQRNFI